MEKAYDLKVLTEKLKARGLDLLEEQVIILVEELSDFVVESAVISKNPYDDIVAAVMPTIKKTILTAADKIDGQVG